MPGDLDEPHLDFGRFPATPVNRQIGGLPRLQGAPEGNAQGLVARMIKNLSRDRIGIENGSQRIEN